MWTDGLEVKRSDELPPLGWLLIPDQRTVLICGRSIEVTGRQGDWTVIEGCWDGPFSGRDASTAANFFGTGAICRDGKISFVTSTHTLDALFVLSRSNRHIVSNSLAFLVGFAGLKIRGDLLRRATSVVKGLDEYDQILYEEDGTRLYRLCCCNFKLDDEGVSTWAKVDAPHFTSFLEYRTYLLNTLAQLHSNSTDPGRRRHYEWLTTCSGGYDSPACAALAAALGCREAITLRTGRDGRGDSGRPVAEALGLSCIERERPARSSPEGGSLEAEFLASFNLGDCVFQVFEDVVGGRLVLTGHPGGSVWDIDLKPNDRLKRGDAAGMGLHEFRLRTDFLHIPVPFIAMARLPDLLAIGHSAEMRPYRCGRGYDRPIPRRIVEEAGVPRALFGQHKVAVNLVISEGRLATSTLRAADRYAKARTSVRFWVAEHAHRTAIATLNAGRALSWTGWSWERRIPKILNPMRLVTRVIREVHQSLFKRYHPVFCRREYANLLTLWALAETAKRYRLSDTPAASTGAASLDCAEADLECSRRRA